MWGRPIVTSKIGNLADECRMAIPGRPEYKRDGHSWPSRIRPLMILPFLCIFCILFSLSATAELIPAHVVEITKTAHGSSQAPHISDGDVETGWYSCQSAPYYFERGTPPVFMLDLGRDRMIDAAAFVNYYEESSNRVKSLKLRFAAERQGGVGTTIPDVSFEVSPTSKTDEAEHLPFSRPVRARYIELTLTDNVGSHTVAMDDITFNALDPIVTITAPSILMVQERALTTTDFAIALVREPAQPVTITVAPQSEALSLVNTDSVAAQTDLVFASDDWNKPQTVTLQTRETLLVNGRVSVPVNLTCSSEDPEFNKVVIAPVYVAIVDAAELITGHVTEKTATTHSKAEATWISDGDVETNWYSGQSAMDYFESGGTPPVFILDFERDRTINGISFVSGYDQSSNRVTAFELRFATSAEGLSRINEDIPTTFRPSLDMLTDQAEFIPLDHPVTARYAELTVTDNLGQHTVTFDEIQFSAIDPVVTITAADMMMVEENALTTERFGIALTAEPTHPVTITLKPQSAAIRIGHRAGGAALDLAFTVVDWNVPQTVMLQTTEETVVDGRKSVSIAMTAASDDLAVAGATIAPLYVAIVDKGGTTEADRSPVTFEDVSAEMGFGGETVSACWVDFDNDGWMDLAGAGLWRNVPATGSGQAGRKFVHVDAPAGSAWGDIDNDGWLDSVDPGGNLNWGSADGSYTKTTLPNKVNENSEAIALLDIDGDGLLDIYWAGWELQIGANQRDGIYRNLDDREFQHIWTSGEALPARSASTADFDNDGDPDIYVSNYRLCGNYLWRNNTVGGGDPGTFTFASASHNALAGNGHSIGSCWGDFDNDGLIDLFAGNFAHGGQPESRFLRNQGSEADYSFEDKGTCGVFYQESYARPNFGDYDNDGDLDLFLTTVYGHNACVMFRNDGDWNFTDVTAEAGLGNLRKVYAVAWCDYDNDGDLDLSTAGRLFRNNGNRNHSLKVKLVGSGAVNRSAIGAQVRIKTDYGIITREVQSVTGGHGNFNGHTLHFGLGGQKQSRTIEIAWPYTKERQTATAAANRVTTVKLRQD